MSMSVADESLVCSIVFVLFLHFFTEYHIFIVESLLFSDIIEAIG